MKIRLETNGTMLSLSNSHDYFADKLGYLDEISRYDLSKSQDYFTDKSYLDFSSTYKELKIILSNIKMILYEFNRATSLEWLKYFPNIIHLDCGFNNLDSTALKSLRYVPNLRVLYLYHNNNIDDLSNLKYALNIRELYFTYTKIKVLSNISTILPNLETLCCPNNEIISIDLSDCVLLKECNCSTNRLTELKIQNTPKLLFLYCDINQLSNLDVTECKSLKKLFCNDNDLTNLNLQGLINLKIVQCESNNLNNLNINGCKILKTLNCKNSKLTRLDLQGLINLKYLYCNYNQLTDIINLSDAQDLRVLYCNDNQLTKLDLSNFLRLTGLRCKNNKILNTKEIRKIREHLNLTDFDCDSLFVANQGLETCYICLEVSKSKTDKIVTECGHVFHESCLMIWINEYALDHSCPYCRQLI